MKKTIFYLAGSFAIVVGCSKESEAPVTSEPAVQKTIIKAVADPMTKTTIDIVGTQGVYSWEADEEIAVFNGTKALSFVSEDPDDGTFSYSGGESTATLSYGVSPVSAYTAVDADSYQLELKSNYTGYVSKVSNAVMVAGAPVEEGGYQKFTFKHAAALIRFTYENVPVGTTGLRFSTTDKNINGVYTVSGTTPELTQANATGTTSTTLTLASAVSSANTTIVFYVPIPTGDYTDFTVTLFNGEGDIAATGKTMTVKAPKTVLFNAGKGSVINTPVITLDRVGSTYYSLITSTGDLSDGDYLIVYETGSLVFDGSLSTLDAARNTISVSISEHRIESSSSVDNAVFTYNSTDKTLKSHSNYYIGRTADSNGMNTDGSEKYSNTITFSESNVSVKASGGAYLRYNKTAGQERFRYFKSTTYTSQEPIQLYKKISTPSGPQLSVPQNLCVDAATKKVTWHSVTNADTYTVTIDGVAHTDITDTYYTSDITDGYYAVSVQAISADHSIRLDSAPAVLAEAKFGNPRLNTPSSFVTGDITDSSIQISWTGDGRATKYHCTIAGVPPTADPATTIIEPTTASVTFDGLTKNGNYRIAVYAIDETGKYGDSAEATTDPIEAVKVIKEYSFTINTSNFTKVTSGSGYTPYNGDHVFTATATDSSGDTYSVTVSSNQVMIQSSKIQFQTTNGYLYNKTDLGTITSITTITGVTQYKNKAEHPSSGSSGGYFTLQATGSTPTATSITIVFEIQASEEVRVTDKQLYM